MRNLGHLLNAIPLVPSLSNSDDPQITFEVLFLWRIRMLHLENGRPGRQELPDDKLSFGPCHGSSESNISSEKRRTAPISLSVPGLSAVLLAFTLLLVALLTLWYLDRRYRGFPLLTQNHYTWTYGPTAVLVLITSFWRQIDHHCKALLPWRELQYGPVAAQHSILLDYVSPLQMVSFFRAARNHHLVVALTVLGFFVLKAITVASTGLLLPVTVQFGPRDVDLVRSTRLDGSDYALDLHYADPSPIYTSYAILTKNYPLPQGTTEQLLYETISQQPHSLTPNATIAVQVSAFVPKIACESLDAFVDPLSVHFDSRGNFASLRLNSRRNQSCAAEHPVPAPNPNTFYCPPRRLAPVTTWLYNCTGNTTEDTANGPLLMLALSDLRYSQTFNTSMDGLTYGTQVQPTKWTFNVASTNAISCRLSYEIEEVRATYNMSTPQQQISIERVSAVSAQLPGFNNSNLIDEIRYSLLSQPNMFSSQFFTDPWQPATDIFFEMMAQTLGTEYDSFLDNDELIKAASRVYPAIAVQIAKKLLVNNDSTVVPGQIRYNDQRLRIESLPLWFMVVGIGFLMSMTTALFFIKPTGAKVAISGSLADIPGILQRSPDYDKLVTAIAQPCQSRALTILLQNRFSTAVRDNKSLILVHGRFNMDRIKQQGTIQQWWTPLTLSRWFLVCTLCFTLLAIVVLQILQELSNRHDGIAPLTGDSNSLALLFTRALPTLLMLLLASMYNSIDFNVVLLSPLVSLRFREGIDDVLRESLLAQFPPLVLLKALHSGYWSALATSTSAFIASVLTVVVSGLYTIEYVPNTVSTSLDILDSWSMNWTSSLTDDNRAAIVSSLVETGDLTYPQFTYDELVFPQFRLSASHNATWQYASGSVNVRVPALRAELTCTNITSDQFNFSTFYYPESLQIGTLSARLPLPDDCHRGSSYGNESFLDYLYQLRTGENASYFGFFEDVHVGPYQSTGQSHGDEIQSLQIQPDNPPGCPSVVIGYGLAVMDDPSRLAATVLMCYQGLKTIDTDTTFSLPGLTISENSPPVPIESTARFISSGTNHETAYWWRLQQHLDTQFKILNGSQKGVQAYTEWPPDISTGRSTFFAGTLYGRSPVSIENLANRKDPQIILDHILKFYRRYMAQTISANMRTPTNPITTQSTGIGNANQLTAQFTPSYGTPRLIQHAPPKLVLQIMLTLMLILVVLAFTLGKFSDLVAWNPCTIAGMSVLFVGSKMASSATLNTTPIANVSMMIKGKPAPSSISSPVAKMLYEPEVLPTSTLHARPAYKSRSSSSAYEIDSIRSFATTRSLLNTTDHSSSDNADAELVGYHAPSTYLRPIDVNHTIHADEITFAASTGVSPRESHPSTRRNESGGGKRRLRLGWWKDGEYVEVDRKKSKALLAQQREDGWRYGIDVVD